MCSELHLAFISSPFFVLLQEVSRRIHHFRIARARLTPQNGARTSVRDVVQGMFADVKRQGRAGRGNVASDVARRVSIGPFSGKRQIVRDRLTACSILLNRPTLSPCTPFGTLSHVYTGQEWKRKLTVEIYRWPQRNSFLPPLQPRPELSSLFIKINLYIFLSRSRLHRRNRNENAARHLFHVSPADS